MSAMIGSGDNTVLTLDHGRKAEVDLRNVGVFDCRTDCWTDVKEQLVALGP